MARAAGGGNDDETVMLISLVAPEMVVLAHETSVRVLTATLETKNGTSEVANHLGGVTVRLDEQAKKLRTV